MVSGYVRDVQQFRGFSGCEDAQYNGVVNGERMFSLSVCTAGDRMLSLSVWSVK